MGSLPAGPLLDLLDLVPGAAGRLTEQLRTVPDGEHLGDVRTVVGLPVDDDSAAALLRALRLAGVVGPTGAVCADRARELARDLDLAGAVAVEAVSRLPAAESSIVMTAAESEDLRSLRRRLRIQPLVQHLEDVVRSAREDLVLAAPYWNLDGLGRLRPAIEGVLARQGAQLTLIAQGGRTQPTSTVGDLRRFIAELALDARRARLLVFEAGSDTGAEIFLHAKVALADSDFGYLGSANMTSQGLGSNLEIGVRLKTPDVLAMRAILERFESLGMVRTVA
jgi:phosphatidylserine/phosphatidylglycerophosphate/cardiolipin synthase-like enzyme